MADRINSVKMPSMSKLLAIFLLIFLPFSWTAAAVAAYCKHETVVAEQQHVGHHDHQHSADNGKDASPDPAQSGGSDPDCAACYAGFATVIPGAVTLLLISTDSPGFADYREYPELLAFERPERPQWRVLA